MTHQDSLPSEFFSCCFPLVNNSLYMVQQSYNEILGHQRLEIGAHAFTTYGEPWYTRVQTAREKSLSSNLEKQGKERRPDLAPDWNPPTLAHNESIGSDSRGLTFAEHNGRQPYRQLM
jgi:hypothetical protein